MEVCGPTISCAQNVQIGVRQLYQQPVIALKVVIHSCRNVGSGAKRIADQSIGIGSDLLGLIGASGAKALKPGPPVWVLMHDLI